MRRNRAARPGGGRAPGAQGLCLPGRRCDEAYVDDFQSQAPEPMDETGEGSLIWQRGVQSCRAGAYGTAQSSNSARKALLARPRKVIWPLTAGLRLRVSRTRAPT